MNLNTTIEKYESSLTAYEKLPNPNPSTAADVRQLIEWLKDYKRLLEKEHSESKSNTSELKPCPFCGTEVKLLREPLWNENHGCFIFSVKCPKCGCTVDYNHNNSAYRSEEEAIANVVKSWNERYVNWFERAKESED